MNRILLERIKNKVVDDENKVIKININEDGNILLNNNYKYVLNIKNCNTNILFDVTNKKDLNIDINTQSSNVVLNIISFIGTNINISAKIKGDSSDLEVYNSHIAKSKMKINMDIDHLSSNTISNIYNFVVAKDDANCDIKVVSRVKKGYKNCNLNQDSRIISYDKINNKIEPILLIDEYDVNASHSAYIGMFNDDYLFYLMSRGLSKKEANNVLLNAFLIGKLKISNEEKELFKNKI